MDELVSRSASINPTPKPISDGRALMVAGFQYNAPMASSGAAVEAPPID
jgi:hypothetical protein